MVLFEKVLELLGGGALVEEVVHWRFYGSAPFPVHALLPGCTCTATSCLLSSCCHAISVMMGCLLSSCELKSTLPTLSHFFQAFGHIRKVTNAGEDRTRLLGF